MLTRKPYAVAMGNFPVLQRAARSLALTGLVSCAACAVVTGLNRLQDSECIGPCGADADAANHTPLEASAADVAPPIDAPSPLDSTAAGDAADAVDTGDTADAAEGQPPAGDGSVDSGAGDASSDSDSNSVRTDADGSTAPPAGLLYYFPLAGDTKDHSGNGFDATNFGATPTTGHSGKANSAYSFNGTTSYLTAPGTDLPIGSIARTLTLWLKPTGTNLQFGVVLWGHGNCTGAMFGLGSEGNTFWGGCDDVGSGAALAAGSWTFLAAVYTPLTQMRVFVNGAGTTYALNAFLNTPPSSLWFGGQTTTDMASGISNYFAGAIDSVRIYGRALSDAEVATVMALP
jgi:hypothetical protein